MKKPPTKPNLALVVKGEVRQYHVPVTKLKQLEQSIADFAVAEDEIRIPWRKLFDVQAGGPKEQGMMLRALRTREDFSQEVLAKKLGIKQSNLSAMELGTRPIGKQLARRIAAVFRVDYRVLL